MNRTIRIGWLALLLAGQAVWAQEQPLARIQQQLASYHSRVLPEKLFLHTDRSFYVAGETMWFRLFYVDGTRHRPLDVSRVAYLDVLDKNQKSVLQTTVALDTGKGAGSLVLPTSLESGSYVVRAYTRWMAETSPELLFEKPITVVNTLRKLDLPARPDTLAWSVQFFPEGGHLVRGLPGRVAFQALDGQTGKGTDCRGVLLTQSNDTIARFTSLKFGIGTFTFTPAAGNTYRVLLRDRRGRSLTRPLPVSQPYGYTMRVESRTKEQLAVTVRVADSSGIQPAAVVYLVAHNRQSVKVATRQQLDAGQATFLVDKASLGEGISHLTVFSAAAQPVCERLYFNRPQTNLTVRIKTDQAQYAPRTPVTLNLTTNSSAGTAVPTDLSVAVYRIDSLQHTEPISLPAYLWLTSDLHGAVESPDYYLSTAEAADATLDEATDNLMLTHGWRRFRWESILSAGASPLITVPEHRLPIVQGRVTDSRTGAPAKDVTTYLSIPGKAVRLYSARSNEQGLVRFEVDHFEGTHDIVMQTAPADSTHRVDVITPYASAPPATPLPPFDLSATLADQLQARHLASQVQSRYYEQPTAPLQPTAVDSSTFYGRPDERYLLDAYTRFITLEEVLSEYVPGVRVFRRNKQYSLRVNNFPYLQLFNDEPLILLDGVPVTNVDRLMALSPLKIKSLDVLTRRYVLGQQILSGIISFRTYKGDLAGFQLDPRAIVLEYDGLQARREFAAPQYTDPRQSQSHLPDFRNLLYWNPSVSVSTQGPTALTFFTSDQTGTYLIVTHGLSADGQSGSNQAAIVVSSLPR